MPLPASSSPPASRFRTLCESGRIPALDGLRALAVLLVVIYHAGYPWMPAGLGVLAFFVLSGFLITWLLLVEHDRHQGISLAAFYGRRALRIFPAFYVYLAAGITYLAIRGLPLPREHTAAAALYVSNYYDGIVRPAESFVSHTWSLAIEEQFYLLWPATMVLLGAQARRHRLVAILALLIALVWGLRLALVLSGVHQSYIYRAFETRMDHLLIGCLLAALTRAGLFDRAARALSAHLLMPALTLALLALSSWLEWRQGPRYRDTIAFVANPLLVAILLVQVVSLHDRGPWRALSWQPLAWLGVLSYGMYLWHPLAVAPVRSQLATLPEPVRVLAMIALTVVVAAGSYFVVERPFLRLKRRLSRD